MMPGVTQPHKGDPVISQDAALSSAADDLVAAVVAALDDDKGEDIVVLDLRGRSSMADHMVIVTGRSTRQVAAMAEHLSEKLKARRLKVALEGLPQGDWVLLDAGDIVVHLFRPDVRDFYNLERLWAVPTLPAASL
jgi:ribosome-associated protein